MELAGSFHDRGDRDPLVSFRRLVAALLVIAIGIGPVACGADRMPDKRMTRGQVILGGERIDVWIADTLDEQEAGLMAVPELARDEGMLFAFDATVRPTFSIKGVDYALDVLFIDADSRISAVGPLSPEGPAKVEGPRGTQWVLELRAGTTRRLGVEPGDVVLIDAPSAEES